MNRKQITVTKPHLPPLNDFIPYLEDIWDRQWLTNNGHYHQELEKQLCEYLGVEYLSLFANGTLALITALQALNITGEVITTPYSFVATTHSIWWNDTKPVFVDIEPNTFNLDPEKIKSAITPKTTAIMPVHVYGNPCNTKEIERIADIYGLKVIYDAAQAFGVKQNNKSVLNCGDLSILSFHATKTFSTLEGGAIICHNEKTKKRIDYLKNFGFADEVTVVAPGINGKMNELQAAFGVLALQTIDDAIARRKEIFDQYIERLSKVAGISTFTIDESITYNYAYCPIFVSESVYGESRDALYARLRENEIYARRYFYPLISEFPSYRGLPSAAVDNLGVAHDVANRVICLPIYPTLSQEDQDLIISVIEKK